MRFDLGREETSEWHTWAPKAEIPKIKANFRTIADGVANALNGRVETKAPE